jgi:hypothetical protein
MKKLTAAAAFAALAFGGCATEGVNEKPENQFGSVASAIVLNELGLVINTIDFTVEDAADAVVTNGTLNVENSSRIEFQVGNLPIANNYEMILSAVTVPDPATQESLNCSGRANFDIADNGVSALTMGLVCQGDISIDVDARGDVRVTVNVTQEGDHVCPVPTGISALPAETQVGSSIQIQGFLSSAADGTTWSAPAGAGTFGDAAVLSTAFTCSAPGVFNLTLTATKERCAETTLDVSVECSGVPSSETICTGGADEDQDGLVDCADPDCATAPACVPDEICDDAGEADEDLDGLANCADPDCAGAPNCGPGEDACVTCARAQCTDFNTLNIAGPCFDNDPNTLFGEVSQPVFTQLCTDAFLCSANAPSNCAADGDPTDCYCGDQPQSQCEGQGPTAQAECVGEWERATGCDDVTDPAARNVCVAGAFQDLTLASGYTYFAVQCTSQRCAAECQY